MIKNYFKVAWRNLVRNKSFSVINIAGLALGMTCSLLIMLWVADERSVDNFHAHGAQLYHVYERQQSDGETDASYLTQGLLAEELKQQIPEVEYASSLERNSRATFQVGEKVNKMDGSNAGEDFFDMFSYKLLQGTPATVLTAPSGIAISRKMAEQFFGSPEEAIGKTIRYENKSDLLVTGVFENLPVHSSVQFDFLRSWKAFVAENGWVSNWTNVSPFTFVQLHDGADIKATENKLKDFIHRYQQRASSVSVELKLQPYGDKYLHSTFVNGEPLGGRIEYVRLFTLVAVFILLIACVNFMNLATARSAKRAKEVGIRKVTGARRSALIGQFMGEAVLLSLMAILIAALATSLLLPAFNSLTGKQLVLPVNKPVFWAALLGLMAVTGLVAGSYPAIFLSSLNPVSILKGNLAVNRGSAFFRKGLVVFQFALSIFLIVATVVVSRQMDYIQHKNLGYNRENLIYVPLEGSLISNYNLFRDRAASVPGILAISTMRESPTVIEHHKGDVGWEGKDPNVSVSFADAAVGYDFIKTMHLKLKEGRDFSADFPTDSANYLINETALQKIGYARPVGQPLWYGSKRGTIIGVLKDFHFNSLHQSIDPLFIRLDLHSGWGTVLVRTRAGKTREVLTALEKLYKQVNPDFPFTYTFADLEYANLYKSEQLVSRLARYFSALAIFISCLGLFGLSAFTAEQRIKEIGVRKVLGASVVSVVSLLSADFFKLVLIAVVIASPVAWFGMHQWLQDFAYHVSIDWWIFALAALLAVGIALLTVSLQSIRAACMNPVKSLRAE